MKKLFLLSVAYFICLSTSNAQYKWSKKDETTFKTSAKSIGISSLGLSEKEANDFAECAFKKSALKYPDIHSLPADFVRNVGKECAKDMTVQWSPKLETFIINKLLSAKEVKMIAPEYRIAYCQCIINQIKIKYPNGANSEQIVEMSKIDGMIIGKECYQQILSKIP